MSAASDRGEAQSPRDVLRQRIRQRDEATTELDGLKAAVGFGGPVRDAISAAQQKVEAAAQALEAAKNDAATALVNRSLGLPQADGLTTTDARSALRTAQDELEASEGARATLEARIPLAESRVSIDMRSAALEVMRTEVGPFASRIWEEWRRIRREAQELDQVVQWLRGLGVIGSPESLPDQYTVAGSRIWNEALAALERNADTQLPPLPGVAAPEVDTTRVVQPLPARGAPRFPSLRR